ncbi:response regulator transcription factor FixJ [Hansschlegelia zhihuaiae]|uniref:Response regulator transcription factor FixJ n=2 Tax=Hansschlegelia zhihuaiae TaxID=405005 RepID=A0A4Q0MIL1_9HYPH|nr:response regulator FixJ [Hansschlegelia zhihuaiae]RXF73193.1 response regulator transcription factor FixJ [Hansschlegelia zhihuaiae]
MTSEVVHVVDDDIAVRQSLAFLLSTDGLPVRVHDSAESFLMNMTEFSGGCIVTDVRMPGIDGLDFLARLRDRGVDMPVIVMTGHADVPLAVEAMKRGAVDFLEKPFEDEALLSAIRTALDRRKGGMEPKAQSVDIRERVEALSERERQVLEGLLAGKANKVIAFDLEISPRTVEIYRANVMTKMQATSLSHLVRLTLQSGSALKYKP